MPEYIVELLMVVEADTPELAEKIGKQALRKTYVSPRVKNVILTEVRGDEADEDVYLGGSIDDGPKS